MKVARRYGGGTLVCLAALLSLLAVSAAAFAQAGDLDFAFGEGGKVATPVSEVAPDWDDGSGPGPPLRPETSYKPRLAAAPDGSLVVAQGNLLLRYLPDGQLDGGFGAGGRLAIETVEGLPFGLADVAIDQEGRILLFGTTVDPSVYRYISAYAPREVNPSFVTVVRLDSTGAPDPSFGNGNGVFREELDLSAARGIPANISLAAAGPAELDSRGRAVVAVSRVGFPPSIRSTPGWVDDTLIRLTTFGQLDPSFGKGDGVVEGILRGDQRSGLLFGGFCISGHDQPMIAVTEFTFTEAGEEEDRPRNWLSRLHTDGSLDRGFGRNGVVRGESSDVVCTRSHVFMLEALPSSRPPLENFSRWRVVRRSAGDGRVRRRFGRNAVIRLRGEDSYLTSIAIDRHGRVLLVGVQWLSAGDGEKDSSFTVIRLLPSGRLDPSFGHGGRMRTSFGRDVYINYPTAVIDAAERPVLAGRIRGSGRELEGVGLARYIGS